MTDVCKDVQVYMAANLSWVTLAADAPDGQGNIFAHKMAPIPDFAVSIQVYSGRFQQSNETFTLPLAIRNPRLQVMVRDFDNVEALAKCEEVLRLLAVVKDQTINGTYYLRIKSVGEPFELGPDAENRQRAVINFEASFTDALEG